MRPTRPVRSVAAALFTFGVCALVGCDGEQIPPDVQRSDSAGVEIVLSPAADRILDWTFEPLFRLGGADDGPESFYQVSARLVDSDARGHLYILNRQTNRVEIFDAAGRSIRSLGGAGGGPGEFQIPGSISVAPDGAVAVFDFRKRHLVRFTAAGEPDDEIALPLFPTPNAQRHFARFGDTLLVSASTSPRDRGELFQRLQRIANPDTAVLRELPLEPPALATFAHCGGSGFQFPPVLAPEIAWDARAGRVAAAITTGFSVAMWEGERLARIVRRDIAPVAATRDDAIASQGEGITIRFGGNPCEIGAAALVDARGYAEVLPLIATLWLSPTGELWLRRFATDPDAPMRIDVFDDSGAYVGTLEREGFEPIILLPDDRVGVVEADENDVQRLAVLAIRR